MIIFFTLLLIALIIGRVLAGYFADVVPLMGALALPLTLICIAVGLFWLILICTEIYNKFKGKK